MMAFLATPTYLEENNLIELTQFSFSGVNQLSPETVKLAFWNRPLVSQ